ncbi:hypothetical protein PFFCH_00096 [Plasmodium falciparum FCH/4]|uniref:Uncharacterized protein n=1 Tax=Plasmodium falciparum FCH/4 TaxID=1036724 RepID=A0A024VX56_PLAFA|nr:hypothetical protein PFFCH_00096 [Plasmodium falciparum FCH/4]
MAAAGNAEPKDLTAKDAFDRIGKIVQGIAYAEALKHRGNLEGFLNSATFREGRESVRTDAKLCKLNYKYHTNVTNGKSDPCGNGTKERFSDTEGGQCYSYRIKGNNSTIGFCAPYRRLHLCVKNLEQIDPENITNTHNLLVDLLLAAQHEGESLVKQYEEYKEKNANFDTNLCTILARSFADIGDIIRGKDLYLDHEPGKQHLEERLERIFENIKKKNNNNELNNLSLDKFREYWWALNRVQVWKAITCKAKKGNIYSKTADDTTLWNEKCGHHVDKDVPTNLDYVPQFLRWFEEWSEEFCRKRNIKLKMAKDACHDYSKQLYCSLNGFDCTKLIQNKDSCSRDSNCTTCSNKCISYDLWLGDQRNDFKMQKGKYENEIKTYVNNNGIPNSNTKIEYYKEFYEEFAQNDNKTVQNFLKLLNMGKYCKTENTEDVIDFTITGDKDAFDRSKYCQPCPDCVVYCEGGECKEKRKSDGKCMKEQIYTRPQNLLPTNINVLFSGENQEDITEKLGSFCSNPKSKIDRNYQTLQCYYKKRDHNNCEMKGSSYKDKHDPNIIISDECFHLWVKNLLIDTIKWETKLKKCINNTNITDCENKCNNNCECFDNWINKKENEWKDVSDVYKDQKEILGIYYKKLENLFDSYFFEVMHSVKEEKDRKWNQLTAKLKEIIKPSKENTDTGNSEDKIKLILEHLKETATTCKDNNSNESCDSSKNRTPNPCLNNTTSSKPTKTVKHIAEMMQRRARKQLEAGAGEINLKGDATKGKYTRGGPEGDFKDVCSINENHSNRNHLQSTGPCGGKDNDNVRFKVGTKWKTGKEVDMSHRDVYLPPRREHMCTSNLEFLQTTDNPLNGSEGGNKVNDSFLGEILLTAYREAERTKDYFKHEKDNPVACRAIRYSFADIADIIRGRDMWDHRDNKKKLQSNLKDVFKNIKEKLPGIQGKYEGDDKKSPPYKKLREDWWEANRHQVWRAMKCATQDIKNMKCNGIPIEDYIPQRLRWMTELAEWFCKFESQENKDCKRRVIKSNSGGNAYMGKLQKCKEYNSKIEEWKRQWRKLEKQYSMLYTKAQIDAFKDGRDRYEDLVEEKDKPVYDFLLDLHVYNRGKVDLFDSTKPKPTKRSTTDTNTPYKNAGGYVHDLVDLSDCKGQINFCNRGMIFVEPDQPLPPDDDNQVPAPEEEDDKVCGIVEKLIGTNNGNEKIEECNTKSYNGWTCETNKFEKSHDGACMPPRRQKLCIHNLKESNETGTEQQLREAFIKCAAAETFLLWQNYKKDKNGNVNNLDNRLKDGVIPDDFKRQMFYTFGDYRDLCLNTDISAKKDPIKIVKNNIQKVFNRNNGPHKEGDKEKRETFWKNHKESIWKGMLCALSYDTTKKNMDYEAQKELNSTYSYNDIKSKLEDFASRPQFLRWFTEWGEQFCFEHTKQLQTLKMACPEKTCTNGEDKQKCTKACGEYKKWLATWKENYQKQSKKYSDDKRDSKFNEPPANAEVNSSTNAYEYLNKALQNICTDEYCNCMKKRSTQLQEQIKSSDSTGNMPASLDDTPSEYKQRCECLEAAPKKEEEKKDSCVIVGEIIKANHGKTPIGMCNPKEQGGNYPEWDCKNNIDNGNVGACMPPRRQKLCLYYIGHENETKKIKTEDDLRKAFIKTAAAETFFAWHYYKSKHIDAEQKLKEGIIPPEFLRSMYYTYGDYRDIFFDTDISEKTEEGHVKNAIDFIRNSFSNDGSKSPDKLSRENWWQTNSPKIWKGMVCALTHVLSGNDKETARTQLTEKYAYHTIKFSGGTNPPTLEHFAQTPQFLRWFTEWGEEFCKKRKEQVEKLRSECEKFECNNGNNEEQKKKCADACKEYQEWLQGWKDQYEQQNAKFDKEKKEDKYKNTPAEIDADESYSAREYLHEQLEKLCDDGKCSCMENPSTQDDETDLPGNNDLPEALDNPPKEFEEKCECSEPSEPMSCVEKTARKLRKIAEKNIDAKLKGNGNTYTDICKNAKREEYANQNGETCIFKEEFWSTNKTSIQTCDSNTKKRFIIDKDWDCNGKTLDGNNKLCIPPRRKDMCLTKLEDIIGDNISDSNTLLKQIQDIAKNEGDDIIKNLLSKYPCNESEICDAMKYSFADIGDIIRGRSQIEPNNGDNIEDNLKKIFTTIKNTNTLLNKMELTQFREKWWDANRKDVWNAMTCVAPNDAHLKKKTLNNSGHNSHTTDSIRGTQEKCGYDREPPDYDYIPERYRFLQEWSEYYCKALKEKNDEMKNKCSECLRNGTCENDKNDNTCEECKKKCEDYTKFVDKWKAQFEEQNEIYKTLYIQDRTHGTSTARRNPSIKFIQQLDKICEDPNTAEKYLDKSTHCTDYKFSETNNNENDAFSPYPKDYKEKCKCKEKSENNASPGDTRSLPPEWFLPKIPGIKTIQNVVPQIPKRIKNIMPDAHTIHELVARSFDYFVPKIPKEVKPPPTHNILNDVLPSAVPVGIALALGSIAFLFIKVIYIYICMVYIYVRFLCQCFWMYIYGYICVSLYVFVVV